MKAQFSVANITSQRTRRGHFLASLLNEIELQVYDILPCPPPDNPYDALIAAIFERTRLSIWKRLHELPSVDDLEHRQPSEILRHIQTLLGKRANTFYSDIFKELFLKRLSPTAQMLFATGADLTLPALAIHADK